MKNEDCPCWGCKIRGEYCRTCEKGKKWREHTIALSKAKITNSDFISYKYMLSTRYLRDKQKGKR